MAILAALCLLAGVFPGLAIDALGRGDASRRRRPYADAVLDRLAVDRAGRREPELLQRASGVPVHRHVGQSGRELHPPLRLRRAAARSAVGLRLPRSVARDAIFGGELRAADPAGVRRRRLRRARAHRHAGARRDAARASRSDAQRQDLGRALRAADRDRRARRDCGSTACSSSPSVSI